MKRTLIETQTTSASETYELGRRFAAQLKPGNVLCFEGDLGAGKTTLIKGICHGLGVKQPVTSPTFTLINEYRAALPIYHFDFYRISSVDETIDLGLEEYFYGDGICLIEWPRVITSELPAERYEFYLKWDFSQSADVRHIKAVMISEHDKSMNDVDFQSHQARS